MAMIVVEGGGYMREEIAEFLAHLGTERVFSPKTIVAYAFDLAKFSEFLDREIGGSWQWSDVNPYTIRSFLQFLVDKGNAPITRGRKLATIKSFFGFLLSDGRLKVNPAAQVRMPKAQQKEPTYLSEKEYKRLLRVVQKNATEYFRARDIAIVTMLLGMGLRLSEIVELDVGSVNFDDGTIKVTRKGNHERILPANDDVMISLNRYLKTREGVKAQEPLFLSKRNKRICNASVWHLVRKYMRQAQIEKDKLSPHTLRHTFATMLLKQGESLLTIKELLSHRNIRTTERFKKILGTKQPPNRAIRDLNKALVTRLRRKFPKEKIPDLIIGYSKEEDGYKSLIPIVDESILDTLGKEEDGPTKEFFNSVRIIKRGGK